VLHLTRQEALELVQQHIKEENLLKHVLATEAIMKALAKKLGQDEEKWGLVGLLHDIDYEEVDQDPARHGMVGADILEGMGMEDDIVHAVRAHNEYHGIDRVTLMDKALYAADPMTGFITAVSLVLPSKNVADVTVKQVKKKLKDKAFARGASRDQINSCDQLGLTLDEFIEISLDAMRQMAIINT
jgi:putative nucleotidyltransferase with HDIG domain